MNNQPQEFWQNNIVKTNDLEKYQTFNTQQENNDFPLPIYSSPPNIQQPNEQKQQPIQSQNFIMPIHPNWNLPLQPIQPQYYQQNQIYANYSVNNVEQKGTQQQINSEYLKDQNFSTQISQVVQSLMLLILHQVLVFISFYGYAIIFGDGMNIYTPYYLIIFIPLFVVSLFLSNFTSTRKQPFSLLVYLANIYLISMIYYCFCSIFKDTDMLGIFIGCLLLICFNTFEIGIIMIYLCLEKENIKFYIILPILCIFYLILLVITLLFVPLILISFLYALFLLISINQSLSGRFNLKYGDVLNMANSYNYGIIFPLRICSF